MAKQKKTAILISVIAAVLVIGTLVAIFCINAAGQKKADQPPQAGVNSSGEAQTNGEKRQTPGETAHRADATADTVISDTLLAKPDEIVFMNETIHNLSEADATTLYNAILKMTQTYQGEVTRTQYTPDGMENAFRQEGALELRYRQKHTYSFGEGDSQIAGEIDGFWVLLEKDGPVIVALVDGKPYGSFIKFSPILESDPTEAQNEYRETVKTVLQKNGFLTPDWKE